MLEPLRQWICDSCNNVINGSDQGYVEGRETNDGKKYGFRIVHHALYSPRKNDGNCYYSNKERAGDLPLGDLVGVRVSWKLSSWIDLGVYHDSEYSGPSVLYLREWTTLFRRLHLPITRKRLITQNNSNRKSATEQMTFISIFLTHSRA
jgi:hypothetical protein